tara:strand:+ start:2092 stop:2283 length:192 start_codon:yes stop_codon:yes gene_type:complete
MGLVSASITLIIGYFTIEMIKKHKETLKNMPIVSDFVDIDENKKISNDAYLIVIAFALKDFIF